MGEEFLAHADARIIDDKTQHRVVFCPLALFHGESHLTALGGKLDGVAYDVQKHLLKLHGVADIIVVQHRIDDALVIDPFGLGLRIADGIESV